MLVVTVIVAAFLLKVMIYEPADDTAPVHEATEKTAHTKKQVKKPSPDEILELLKAGNERFYSGNATHPHMDAARLELAGKENQGDYALSTVIACADSRVPVERIFDNGIMDMFVIRVAGNLFDTDEIGTAEYGMVHVHTPLLVVLGHTQCGAVTAVTHTVQGRAQKLERSIVPLVDNIIPAVKRTIEQHPDVHGDDIIPLAIEENVYQAIEDLFMESPAVRNVVKAGKAAVVGAIYDVGTGKVEWLGTERVSEILTQVEADPDREIKVYAE